MCCRCGSEADWSSAAPYYNMAGLTPMEVVNRVKMIEIPSELALTRKHQVCDGGCQPIESACTCGFLPFRIAVPPLITSCVVLQAENIF